LLRERAAGGYARCILSLRSGLVAVVTSVTLAFATPAFPCPPQAGSAGTPPAALPADGATSVQSEEGHEGAVPQAAALEPPLSIWTRLADPLEVTHGRFALQPWEVYGGTLAPVLPNGGATQTILSKDAKIVIIVVAIVAGVILLTFTLYYGNHSCFGCP
jgi:hypothetical protein